jgi:imidazolonepropionase-like amidohydrolase
MRENKEAALNESRRRPAKLIVIALATCLLLWLPLSAAAKEKSKNAGQQIILKGARVYPAPGAPPIKNGTVVIENGRIAAIGSSDVVHFKFGSHPTIIQCEGKTVVAGFWNSHVHFTEPKWQNASTLPAGQLSKQLQDMLTRYGFTSVVDTASVTSNTVALRERIEKGEIPGPRILTAGLPLYPENGIPYYVLESVPPEVVKLMKQPATPQEAVQAVDDDIAQGADIIKLFVVSWVSRNGRHVPLPMRLDIVQAAVNEANRKGKLVFAHPSTIEGVELVLKGHVDVLAHTIEGPADWTPDVVARLKAANVSLIPTLALFNSATDINTGILHEVKSYADAGGTILFGTDVGYLTNYADLTREFDLMKRAGLTFTQILASLTTAPAEGLGFAKTTGRLANGMDADLVVLDGDPAQDIMALSRVVTTIRKGKIIYESGRN